MAFGWYYEPRGKASLPLLNQNHETENPFNYIFYPGLRSLAFCLFKPLFRPNHVRYKEFVKIAAIKLGFKVKDNIFIRHELSRDHTMLYMKKDSLKQLKTIVTDDKFVKKATFSH